MMFIHFLAKSYMQRLISLDILGDTCMQNARCVANLLINLQICKCRALTNSFVGLESMLLWLVNCQNELLLLPAATYLRLACVRRLKTEQFAWLWSWQQIIFTSSVKLTIQITFCLIYTQNNIAMCFNKIEQDDSLWYWEVQRADFW